MPSSAHPVPVSQWLGLTMAGGYPRGRRLGILLNERDRDAHFLSSSRSWRPTPNPPSPVHPAVTAGDAGFRGGNSAASEARRRGGGGGGGGGGCVADSVWERSLHVGDACGIGDVEGTLTEMVVAVGADTGVAWQ